MARSYQEEQICNDCASFLAFLSGEAIDDGKVTYPDCTDRQEEAVDALFSLAGRQHWLELTRVEPFPEEILGGKKLLKAASIVEQLQPPPGRFHVSFHVGAFAGAPMSRVGSIAQALVPDVLSAMRELTPGEERALSFDDVAGVVVVERAKHFSLPGVFVARPVLGDLEEQRAKRVRVAVDKKLPKLLESASGGDATVLLLHSHDISLSNVYLIAEAFRAVTGEHPPVDELVILETEIADMPLWYSVVTGGAYRDKYHAHLKTTDRGWMLLAEAPL